MRQGIALVLSAPSGAGKTTLVRRLRAACSAWFRGGQATLGGMGAGSVGCAGVVSLRMAPRVATIVG